MSLEPFFNPKGVAIIGASQNPHKLGYGVVRNLKNYRYSGGIYPVNRTASEILDIPCYATLAEVPDPVDLAIIVVPANYVLVTLKHCGDRGIKNAVVVSGGFSETGEEGSRREEEMLETARELNIRIIGPNCIGTIDTHNRVNTTFVTGMPEQGEIGFSSQSGAMVAAVIDWARGAGVGFSRIVSLGNQADVKETEMIESISQDRHTKVITAYMEGVSDGRRFMEVAEKAARSKPFVVLKAGRGESGAKAVVSHTGALAGSSDAYQAAFKRCGIHQAETTEEMFDWARALAWQPLPKGRRVAVLTNAGGPAILAVDAMEKAGLELSSLTDHTKAYLKSRMPAAASISNPVDVLAGSGPATYAVALDALLADETVDAVAVIQAPQDWFLPASLAEVVAEVASVHNKPVITSLMGKVSIDDALTILHKRHVPNVAFPERVASVLKTMVDRKEWLELQDTSAPDAIPVDTKKATQYAKDENWGALLQFYDIKTPEETYCESREQAVAEAQNLGYPVVMKLVSPDITHKTDIGGVRLNLQNEEDVTNAWEAISSAASRHNGTMSGVLVQKMLIGGQEVIVGIHQDQQFGPMILFGSGGVDVELFKDVKSDLCPLNEQQADALIDATHAGTKLKGWRSLPTADRNAVRDVLLQMSRIAVHHPEITELEINPLYVMPDGGGAYAIDIRGSFDQKKKISETFTNVGSSQL